MFSIIEKGFAANNYEFGVSFDDIKAAYLDEAKMVKEVELGKDDIQTMALRQILLGLLRDQMVYQTDERKYGVQASELLPGFGRFNAMERAGYDILFLLSTQSGIFDDQKLQTRMIDKFQLTPQEYRFLITQLIKEGYVVRDDNGYFYSASTPPKDEAGQRN